MPNGFCICDFICFLEIRQDNTEFSAEIICPHSSEKRERGKEMKPLDWVGLGFYSS